jgi:shikimate kinase
MKLMVIFLIGFMGSGKSTLGKRLARKIDYRFEDMDQVIEEQENMPVSDIFRQKGEAYFRELETKYLDSVDETSDLVIATGGGAPCFGNNMEMMNSKGVTVYLRLNAQGLVSRLVKARNIRPLIASMSPEKLFEFISETLPGREKFYNRAKCILKGESAKPSHVIALLFDKHNVDDD